MPFFSVIIPTFNRLAVLPQTIETVLQQSFPDFELIVVDDGSTDGTVEWVREQTDKRIRYVYQMNAGVSAARNNGAMIANGDYFVFLDSDDFVTKDWLLDFSTAIIETDASIVSCNRVIDGRVSTVNVGFLAGTFAIEKKIFKDVGMYDTMLKFGENTELKWRLDATGYKIHPIQKANVIYNMAEAGAGKNRRNRLDFFLYVAKKHVAMFQKDKRVYQLLTQVAGVDCYHLGSFSESRRLLFQGYCIQPSNLKALFRYMWYAMRSFKKEFK